MEHAIITRDANNVSWAEIWECSKSQPDIIDAVTIAKIIVFEIICYVAWYSAAKFTFPIEQPSNKCQGHPVSLWRWPLTCNLEKCSSLRSCFAMYILERRLRYLHLLTTHCTCNLLPEPTSPIHEYREKFWGHPVTSSMMPSSWKFCFGITIYSNFKTDLFWDLVASSMTSWVREA